MQKLPIFGINSDLGNLDIVNHSRNVVILVKVRGVSPPYDLALPRYANFGSNIGELTENCTYCHKIEGAQQEN